MQEKNGLKTHCTSEHSLVETTTSKTRADSALFMLPFRALIARCFGSVRTPSPVVIITVAGKRSAVSDWHSKWPFCQGGDSDMSSAQADTHLKPSQFNEAQRVDSNKSCLSPLLSQNRFQALLDEIIQQEEREMEQVRTFCVKSRGSVLAGRFLQLSALCTNLSCKNVKYHVSWWRCTFEIEYFF